MSAPVIRPLAAVVEEFERAYLVAALRAHGGKKAETASTLGVSRKSLWLKMRAYGIGPAEITPPTALPVCGSSPACEAKGKAQAKAERAVLEAAASFVDELIDPCEDDETAIALVAAVKAWRSAQAEHATAAVEALAGVTT